MQSYRNDTNKMLSSFSKIEEVDLWSILDHRNPADAKRATRLKDLVHKFKQFLGDANLIVIKAGLDEVFNFICCLTFYELQHNDWFIQPFNFQPFFHTETRSSNPP